MKKMFIAVIVFTMALGLSVCAKAEAEEHIWDGLTCTVCGKEKEVLKDGNWNYVIGDETRTAEIVAYNGKDADVIIPDQLGGIPVTAIGEKTFRSSSPRSITIPDSVSTIVGNPFEYRYVGSNTKIIVSPKHPYLAIIEGVLFEKATKRLVTYPSGRKDSTYVIPDGILEIGDRAFSECHDLTSITIPNSVTSVGDYAFYNCHGLTSMNLPIGLISIGDKAFYNCSKLSKIHIPSSVTTITGNPFARHSLLGFKFTLSTVHPYFSVIDGVLFEKASERLVSYGNGTPASYVIPAGTLAIEDSAFFCANLTSITIPDSVTSIGDNAFYLCTRLTSIVIPNSVTSIGENVFYGCANLTSITIPNSVTSIGDAAFSSCNKLTSIVIPNGVTSIGDRVFSECSNLTNITIPDSVISIGNKVFKECPKLTVTVTEGSYAEQYCIDNNLNYVYPDALNWLYS